MSAARLALLLLLALLLGACQAPAAPSTLDAGPPDAPDAPGDAASADAGPPPCSEPKDERPDGGACLLGVEATVLDEAGAPIADLLLSVCGSLCFFGVTGTDGRASIPIGLHLRDADYSLLLHGRPTRAAYYVSLPAPEANIIRFPRPLRLPTLPDTGPILALDGAIDQTLTSGDVTVTLPRGTTVEPSIEDVLDPKLPLLLRARTIALDAPSAIPAFLDGVPQNARPTALYAVSPYEAILTGPGARLSFANPLAHRPGTTFDLLALGSLLDPQGPPPGRFQPIGTATVRPGGTRIDTDAPVHFFTWFGLRPKGP